MSLHHLHGVLLCQCSLCDLCDTLPLCVNEWHFAIVCGLMWHFAIMWMNVTLCHCVNECGTLPLCEWMWHFAIVCGCDNLSLCECDTLFAVYIYHNSTVDLLVCTKHHFSVNVWWTWWYFWYTKCHYSVNVMVDVVIFLEYKRPLNCKPGVSGVQNTTPVWLWRCF